MKTKPIPGPSFGKLLSLTPLMRRDPIAFGHKMFEEYGNVVKFSVGPYKVIAMNEPAYHHWVLKENWENYIKGKAFEKMEPVMGEGLLTAPHEFWRQNRAIVQPNFRLARFPEYHQKIVECCEEFFARWRSEESKKTAQFDVHQELMDLTLAIITRTIFDTDFASDKRVAQAIHDFMIGMEAQLFHLFKFQKFIPIPKNLRSLKALKFMDSIAYELIAKRRKDFEGRSDLISLLIQASQKDGAKGITDKYLRDEVLNFLIAGHETTASSLSFCLYKLSQHPDVLSKVRAEIHSVLGGGEMKYESLDKLHYLDKVINEVMRILPPVWAISREARADDNIDGYHIPKGCIVTVAPYYLHHRSDIWPDPHRFDPERFNEDEVKKRPKHTFHPFGLGPRTCIAETFARMEMKTFLVLFLRNFDFEIDQDIPLETHATVTLRPKYGLFLRAQERKD
jgi:cytochrome P450